MSRSALLGRHPPKVARDECMPQEEGRWLAICTALLTRMSSAFLHSGNAVIGPWRDDSIAAWVLPQAMIPKLRCYITLATTT
jgi:hypothetical protein